MNSEVNLIEMISKLSRLMRRHNTSQDPLSDMGHHVLRIIMRNDGIQTSELARLAGVRPASITEAINRLEKLGYVVREKDDIDSRVKRIFITDKTREHIEEHTKAKMERNRHMLSCLTEEEIEVYFSISEKLCAYMETDEYYNLP